MVLTKSHGNNTNKLKRKTTMNSITINPLGRKDYVSELKIIMHYNDNSKVIKGFIKELSIDVNEQDILGKTILMFASRYNQFDLVRYLVEECGANIHIKDVTGHDALYMAAYSYNLNIVCYLLNCLGMNYGLMLAHPEFEVRACVKEIIFFNGMIEEMYNISRRN